MVAGDWTPQGSLAATMSSGHALRLGLMKSTTIVVAFSSNGLGWKTGANGCQSCPVPCRLQDLLGQIFVSVWDVCPTTM